MSKIVGCLGFDLCSFREGVPVWITLGIPREKEAESLKISLSRSDVGCGRTEKAEGGMSEVV